MTGTNLYGAALSRSRIRSAVIAHLQLWFPHYLAELERQEEFRSDGTTTLNVGDIERPRSWRQTTGPVRKWPEDQLPAVIFGSSGFGKPYKSGDGSITAAWSVELSAVISGDDYESTEWLVSVYTAALRLLLLQQPKIEGLQVADCVLEGEAYDELPFESQRTLAAGTVAFTLQIGEVANVTGGPIVPPDDPNPDPGPWPTASDVELDIERTPIA